MKGKDFFKVYSEMKLKKKD